jgi:hypothetical protein
VVADVSCFALRTDNAENTQLWRILTL